MRELFSHRNKLKDVRTDLQIEEFDQYTKNELWDVIVVFLKSGNGRKHNKQIFQDNVVNFFEEFYSTIIQVPLDQMPQVYRKQYTGELSSDFTDDYLNILDDRIYNKLRTFFFDKATYNEILDIIEILVYAFDNLDKHKIHVFNTFNKLFQDLKVGYRIHDDGKIYPAHTEEEYNAINEAMKKTTHIQKATQFLYDRKKKPDYKNSIKESISAVEQVCQEITGDKKATLGQCLKAIDNNTLHPALKQAFSKLYGYTSDQGGIRHAEGVGAGSSVEFEDAEFMLVACSAFVNYLQAKQGKAKSETTKS